MVAFRIGLAALVGGLLMTAQPTLGREALPVEAGAGWTHPHSGIQIPYKLAGLERTSATAFADDFLDVGLAFDLPNATEALSVYVFRNTNGDIPVWFAQAQYGVENRAMFGTVQPVGDPIVFDPTGNGGSAGLKLVYRTSGATDYASTGVVLFSVGEWFVKLRASSTTRSAPELEAWLDQAISELTLPPNAKLAKGVAPVADCPEMLRFDKKSKDAPQDMAATLFGGLLGAMSSEKQDEDPAEGERADLPPVVWCRDVRVSGTQVVYRPDQSRDSYLLAFGDNGNGVWISPESDLGALLGDRKDKNKRYSVTLKTAGMNSTYVAQDRLPSPERVIELVNGNRKTIAVPTWGDSKTIELSSDAIE